MRIRGVLIGLGLSFVSLPPAHSQSASLDDLLAVRISGASKLEQTSMRAPASVTIVTSSEIERFGWRTLAEALQSVNGLYVTSDHNYSYVGVRGFSRPTDYNNRVLILINGLRVNEDVFGYAGIGTDLPLDMRAVERIEVVRGPGSVAFGTAAMLAVVNVVLRGPASLSGGSAAVEAGDPGHTSTSIHGATSMERALRVAWSAMVSRSDGEDFSFPEYAGDPGGGVSANADWDRGHGLTLHGNYRALEFTGYSSQRKKGIPTGAYDTDLGDRRTSTEDGWTMLGASWRRPLPGGWSLRAGAQLGAYDYRGTYPYAGFVFRDRTEQDWWGADVQATWEPNPQSRSTAGVEWRANIQADYRTSDEFLGTSSSQDLPHRIAALYAEHEWQLSESLLLTGGARLDDHSEASSSVSPRLALVYLPDRSNSLKLLAGRAFRAPSVYELTNSEIPGDPSTELDPETIDSLEVAWERRLGSTWFATVSAFRYRMNDLIEVTDTVLSPSGLPRYVNLDSATSLGIELEASGRFPSGLWIVTGASLQRAENDSTSKRLSNSPAGQFNVKLSSPLGANWQAATEAVYETGRDTVVATTTAPFLLVNANLAWQSPTRPWRLELQARNLFDREYFLPGGLEHRQDALVQLGRALSLRLEVRF